MIDYGKPFQAFPLIARCDMREPTQKHWAMNQTHRNLEYARARHREIVVLLTCFWLLLLTIFSVAGRDASTATSLFSYVKVAIRCGLLVILTYWVLKRGGSIADKRVLRVFLPFVLFSTWCIISTLWSALPWTTISYCSSLILLLLLAVATAMAASTTDILETIIKHVSAGMLLFAVVFLIIYFFFPSFELMDVRGNGDQGDDGAKELLHHNVVASTASVGLVILMAARVLWNWSWTTAHLRIAIFAYPALLFLAGGRMATGLALLFSSVLFFARPSRLRVGSFLVFVGGILAVGGVLTISGVLENQPELRILSEHINKFIFADRPESALYDLSGRAKLWSALWSSFTDSPLIGHGFGVTSASGKINVWHTEGNIVAHNLFYHVAITTGVIGLFLFLWSLLSLARLWTHQIRYGVPAAQRIGLFAVIIFAWYMLWGLTTISFMKPIRPQVIVFFLIIGVAAGSLIRGKEDIVKHH